MSNETNATVETDWAYTVTAHVDKAYELLNKASELHERASELDGSAWRLAWQAFKQIDACQAALAQGGAVEEKKARQCRAVVGDTNASLVERVFPRAYDISDIVVRELMYGPSDIGLQRGLDTPDKVIRAIVDLIHHTIAPDSWHRPKDITDGGVGVDCLGLLGGELNVRQTAENHEAVAALIARWRADQRPCDRSIPF